MTCRAAAGALIAAAALTACGKEGPPLPPLVRTPVAPASVVAERRGDEVDLRFVIPDANTDNSRPADVSRVDVYAITGTGAAVTDEQLLEAGTRIGSVNVKVPSDDDEDERVRSAAPVTDVSVDSAGMDQGATAHMIENLTAEVFMPAEDLAGGGSGAGQSAAPLLGPPPGVLARTYGAVGVSARNRRGPVSARAAVPLVAAPLPPAPLQVKYDETAVTLAWPPAQPPSAEAAGADKTVLPSRPIGMPAPMSVGYHVYELGNGIDPAAPRVPRRLTEKPIGDATYADARVEWGVERCYALSVVHTFDTLAVESVLSKPHCVTLTDTFAPASPAGVTAVASEGAMSLIWDPNKEPDHAGYLVLRATVPGAAPQPLTPAAIQETSYRDTTVAPGQRYAYAVVAVDKAGNASAPSAAVEETAR